MHSGQVAKSAGAMRAGTGEPACRAGLGQLTVMPLSMV
jgi:hypothetical protein